MLRNARKPSSAERSRRASTAAARGPLRRIVEVLRPAGDLFGRQKVGLECGHEASASAGAIYRARCRACAGR